MQDDNKVGALFHCKSPPAHRQGFRRGSGPSALGRRHTLFTSLCHDFVISTSETPRSFAITGRRVASYHCLQTAARRDAVLIVRIESRATNALLCKSVHGVGAYVYDPGRVLNAASTIPGANKLRIFFTRIYLNV